MRPPSPRLPRLLRCVIPALGLSAIAACSGDRRSGELARAGDSVPAGDQLFARLPSSATGVRFTNRIEETNEHNVFTYRNYYNGGGVGIGDLTGDGLPELVLTSNQKGPRLFLNEGAFRFRDVTDDAGLETPKESWSTGVAL